jgi:hypothetical protein
MSIKSYVISARFLMTISHFIMMILVWELGESNIHVSLTDSPSSSAKALAYSDTEGALVFSLLCFICDFSGIFFGNSIFIMSVNYFQILSHFVGGLLMSWYLLEHWNIGALWPIILGTNMLSGLVEVCVFIGFLLKINV